jgi:hypothetical protein
MKDIKISITIGKWGLFEPFDGEIFCNNIDDIFNSNRKYYKDYQWYIQTIQKSKNVYVIYYIPTNSYLIKNPETKVEKFIVTKQMLIDYLKTNNKFGIWEINLNREIVIDNMIFYYLGLGSEVGKSKQIKLNRSNKFRETRKFLKEYSK